MKNLTETLAPHINSPRIKALIDNVGAEAAARARTELLTTLLSRHERGISDPLPENLIDTLKADKAKAETEANQSQRAAVRAVVLLQAEGLAASAGAINPSVVAMALEKNVNADIDKSGELKLSIIDPATGKALFNPHTGECYTPGQFIAKMRADTETSFLFDDGNGNKSSKGADYVVNPWKTESHNLTIQAQILKSDPTLATRLKSEAGQR